MTLPGYKIRRAQKSEISQIEDLSIEAFSEYREYVPALIYEAYYQDLRNLGKYWDEADVLVAEESGEIAGSVQFYSDASTEGLGLPSQWAGFRKLVVPPSKRGRGIGKMLIEACIATASNNRVSTVGIHTAPFMTAARHLYEAMAFKRAPEYDLLASAVFGTASSAGDVSAIAYQLDISGLSQKTLTCP